MMTVMTTENLPRHKRFAVWREAVCDHFIHVECHPTSDRCFAGDIASTKVKDVTLSLARTREHRCVRTPSLIRRSGTELVFIHQQLSGTWHYAQDGREGTLGPGDFTCLDGTRPYTAIQDDNHAQLVLHMQRDQWVRRFGQTEQLAGRAVRANTPMGTLAANTLQQILSVMEDAQPHTAERLIEVSLSLIIAAFGDLIANPEARQRTGRMALLRRAKMFIDENFQHPDLNPRRVADALGISERYLQDLFHDEEMTAGKWIWETRLEKCRQRLSDPLFAGQSISEIAFNCGFRNFSHFSHRFKTAFSMTASECRRLQQRARQ